LKEESSSMKYEIQISAGQVKQCLKTTEKYQLEDEQLYSEILLPLLHRHGYRKAWVEGARIFFPGGRRLVEREGKTKTECLAYTSIDVPAEIKAIVQSRGCAYMLLEKLGNDEATLATLRIPSYCPRQVGYMLDCTS
jgi:hypothetical protein